jgi:transposase-like protein
MLGIGIIDVMGRAAKIREYERRRSGERTFEWRMTKNEIDKIEKDKAKAKEKAKKATAKVKLSEIVCPKCKHTGVTKYAQKVHPEDTKKPDNEMRYLQIYRCKTCWHEFTLKEDKTAKPVKPKETPHQKEVRVLKEKLGTAQEKIKQQTKLQTNLRKEIKALKADVELLKKEGIFPKGIPGQPKRDPNKDRFANLDL